MDTTTPRPVVVGVDGSPQADRALEWAADFAAQRDLPLIILYAVWPIGAHPNRADDVTTAAWQLLQRAQERAHAVYPGVVAVTEFITETPAEALIHASQTATIVVVGSRGHGGFHDLLLGSTSLHTAMHARCPVAVIRPTRPATHPGTDEAERIVVGVDGSLRSGPAIGFAFEYAKRTGRGVTAVHAWQGPITAGTIGVMTYYVPGQDDQRRYEEQLLAEAMAIWHNRCPDVDIRQVTVQMSAAQALVELSMGSHLTVVGSRGLGGFTGLLLGSTGQALIHHGGSPVVIAHPSPG